MSGQGPKEDSHAKNSLEAAGDTASQAASQLYQSVTGSEAAHRAKTFGPGTDAALNSPGSAAKDAEAPTSWTGGGADAIEEAGQSISESIRFEPWEAWMMLRA
ncbi:hypothetical protein WJX84_009072 [Apatococcus fuscideae]|uniref:Uncharacterized protein n=1 Tax=Apatococcus fuscideae TaxID=2026836 RepID=A0AAW1TDH7_9CHLO